MHSLEKGSGWHKSNPIENCSFVRETELKLADFWVSQNATQNSKVISSNNSL